MLLVPLHFDVYVPYQLHKRGQHVCPMRAPVPTALQLWLLALGALSANPTMLWTVPHVAQAFTSLPLPDQGYKTAVPVQLGFLPRRRLQRAAPVSLLPAPQELANLATIPSALATHRHAPPMFVSAPTAPRPYRMAPVLRCVKCTIAWIVRRAWPVTA